MEKANLALDMYLQPRALRCLASVARSSSTRTLNPRLFSMGHAHMDIQKSHIAGSRPLNDADAKWIGLRAIEWIDPTGRNRVWECADRKTRKGEVDGMF